MNKEFNNESEHRNDEDLKRIEKELKHVEAEEREIVEELEHIEKELETIASEEKHHEHPKVVEIFIDKKPRKSPNPTTGEALYLLGGIDPNLYDLYKEVQGKGDDDLIKYDKTVIHLREGECFYSAQKNLNPGCF